MSKNLYIIGNGFDIWQGLPTSYDNFNCYMCRNHSESHERIGQMYNQLNRNMLWKDFENQLSELNITRLVERNVDHWLNLMYANINNQLYVETEISNSFDTLDQDIKDFFHEWVNNIDYSKANNKRISNICKDKNALFLTFNYTNTLERFYEVQEERICYIHRCTSNNSLLRPVVGHGISNNIIEKSVDNLHDVICKLVISHNKLSDIQLQCEHMADMIISQIKEFLNGLYKDTKSCLDDNGTWFSKLTDIENIYVLGHSLSEVDARYFEFIRKKNPDAKWHVSYYGENDKGSKERDLRKLLKDTKTHAILIKPFQLDDLCCKE